MPTLQTVFEARDAVNRYVTRTPLVPAYSLSDDRREVRLKLECMQPVGAFKIRGAVNALAQLTPDQLNRGVVCASTGNHGRALAYGARLLGAKATICMSSLVPDNKLRAIAELGADVRIHGNSQDEAQVLVDELVAGQGMSEIPPFDHAGVIAGQGTIGLEIVEDWPRVDTLIAGLSGGGLIGGMAVAAKAINPNVRVVGVSPGRGAAMAASLDAGKPVDVEELPTLADSLGGGIGLENRYTFDLVRDLVDEVVLLSEGQIADAMRHLFLHERLVVEGAGAVGAAVLLDSALRDRIGERVAIVVSGRNVDMDQFQQVIQQTHPGCATLNEAGNA